MYTKNVPFKDFHGKPRNQTVNFNLTEPQVLKLLNEFRLVFDWRDSIKGDYRDLDTAEVVEFFTAFEEILLASYGVPSEDGMHFKKAGRYEFEESACFAALMVELLSDMGEVQKLLDEIMPKGMDEMLKKQLASMEKMEKDTSTEADLKAEIAALRAKMPSAE